MFNPQTTNMSKFLADKKRETKAHKVSVILRHTGMGHYKGVDVFCYNCDDAVIHQESLDTPELSPHNGYKWATWSVM